MKLMKAVKQLKFWSRKKKRKKGLQYHKLDYHDYDHYYIQPTYDHPPSRPPPPLPTVGVYKVTRPLDTAGHWKQSYEDPPPPPPSPPSPKLPPIQCQYHFCVPSAPPLPPWVTLESTFETYSYSTHHYNPIDPISNTDQPSSSSQSNSNQWDSNPVMEDGELAIITAMNGRVNTSRNVFRCVVDVGALFLRWFGPCFGVAEHRRENYSGGSIKSVPNLVVSKKIV